MARDMAKLVECLPSTDELWGLLSQEDQEFTSILNYVDCVRPAWIHEICEREGNGGRKVEKEGGQNRCWERGRKVTIFHEEV